MCLPIAAAAPGPARAPLSGRRRCARLRGLAAGDRRRRLCCPARGGLAAWLRRSHLAGGPAAGQRACRSMCRCRWTPGRPTAIPAHLRRAATTRHPHCAFPGCDQPASVCHIHHMVPRSARRPHRAAQPGAAVQFPSPDRHPPLGLDPAPAPRRHHHRHQPRRPTYLPQPRAPGPRPAQQPAGPGGLSRRTRHSFPNRAGCRPTRFGKGLPALSPRSEVCMSSRYVRLFSDASGESHFQDIAVQYGLIGTSAESVSRSLRRARS